MPGVVLSQAIRVSVVVVVVVMVVCMLYVRVTSIVRALSIPFVYCLSLFVCWLVFEVLTIRTRIGLTEYTRVFS